MSINDRIKKWMEMDDTTLDYFIEMENILHKICEAFNINMNEACDFLVRRCDVIARCSDVPAARIFYISNEKREKSAFEILLGLDMALKDDEVAYLCSLETGEVLGTYMNGVWELQ